MGTKSREGTRYVTLPSCQRTSTNVRVAMMIAHGWIGGGGEGEAGTERPSSSSSAASSLTFAASVCPPVTPFGALALLASALPRLALRLRAPHVPRALPLPAPFDPALTPPS